MTDSTENNTKKKGGNYFTPVVLILVSAIVIIATVYKHEDENKALSITNNAAESKNVTRNSNAIKADTNVLASNKDSISQPEQKKAAQTDKAIIHSADAASDSASSSKDSSNNTANNSVSPDAGTTNKKLSNISQDIKPAHKVETSADSSTLANKQTAAKSATGKTGLPETITSAKNSTKPIKPSASTPTNLHDDTAVVIIAQEEIAAPAPASVTEEDSSTKQATKTQNANKQEAVSNQSKPGMQHSPDNLPPHHYMYMTHQYMHPQPPMYTQHRHPYGFNPENPAINYQPYYTPAPRPQFNPRFNPQFNPQFNRQFNRMPQQPVAKAATQHNQATQSHQPEMVQRHQMMMQAMKKQRLENENRVRLELENQAKYLAQIQKIQKRDFQRAEENRHQAILRMQKINQRYQHLQNKIEQLIRESVAANQKNEVR